MHPTEGKRAREEETKDAVLPTLPKKKKSTANNALPNVDEWKIYETKRALKIQHDNLNIPCRSSFSASTLAIAAQQRNK